MSNVFPVGITVPLDLLIVQNGVGIIQQTPALILQNINTSAYWDGNNSFSNSLVLVPMFEVDSVNQPGLYRALFNQSIENTASTYVVYYSNSGVYQGASTDELIFSFINSQANPVQIAKAVQATIFTNPQGQINPDDVASMSLLSEVSDDVDNIENNMALQSTLMSFISTTNSSLSTIIGIIQPVSGPNQVTFSVLDQSNNPIPGVFLSIKNTTSQITLASSVTDINGQLTLGLPTGIYNLLPFKPFYSWGTLPIQFTVTSNQTITVNGTSFQPTAPSPNLCQLFSYILDASGQPVANVPVRVKYVTNYPFTGGQSSLITKGWVEVFTDATGFWSANVIQGATMELNIVDIGISISEFVVPPQSSLDVSTLLDHNN